MAKGESIHDTSRVISGYVDAIVVRHPEQGSVAQFAAATHVPVINGGDGPGRASHPGPARPLHDPPELAAQGRKLDGAPHRNGRRPEARAPRCTR
jgi:aspartate carbamoyltransferase catalytic subunit